MSVNLRDAQPTVVQCDTEVIKGNLGVAELIARPSTVLRACYAAPKASSSSVTLEEEDRSSWLVGDALEAAEKEDGFKEKYELRWPFRTKDWEGRAYLLLHLYSLLGIKISSNTSPLLLLPPGEVSLDTQAMYCQIAFEQLNVPGFSLIPTPLASLFALNATTGIVLHIGQYSSGISIVVDSIVRWECSTIVEVGMQHCKDHLEKLLMEDPGMEKELTGVENKRKAVKEIIEIIWKECTGDDIEVPAVGSKTVVKPVEDEVDFDVAKKLVGETPAQAAASHKSKKAQAAIAATKAAADLAAAEAAIAADVISFQVPSLGREVTVGAVRHRLCEPLLLGSGDTVWEGIGRAVASESLSVAERLSVWEGVAVVGEMARFKSLPPALITYLSPYLLSSSDLPSDVQPTRARLLSIPDYFTNYKGSTSDLAPFLGASMVAKMAFTDAAGKHHVTKVDYNAKGPAAIYTVVTEE